MRMKSSNDCSVHRTASRKTGISWNWATLAKNVFYIKMIRRNVRNFSFLFSIAMNITHIEKKLRIFQAPRRGNDVNTTKKKATLPKTSFQSTLNSHVVEDLPDLEMHSAQAVFLDFEQPDANERSRVLRPSIPMQARPTAMLQLPLDLLNPKLKLIQENWCRSCLNFWYDLAQPLKDLDSNLYQNC